MSSPTIAGTTVIGGRYVVERQLGYGATSTVYLCRDRQTTNLVAVKVLRPELAESLGADRFLREIRLTAGLEHPNIVPVIDSGADGNTLYCVLPYMEGGTLRDLLMASKQLPIERAVDIGCTIARALAHAHAKGLIHRDIKPENILFGNGRAYLGDFGIARLLHATAGELTTTTGVVRGTPAYMSPEQASGERNYDGRSDIYSLAAVVYEMVSGMPPFTGPTVQSVLAQRFSTTPRPMRTYRNTVSPELERVIAKAMCTSPADRQATAEEFADELESAGRAALAPGRIPRRWVVAGVGAAAIAVIAGASIVSRAGSGRADFTPDTTQLAVMTFDREGDTRALGSVDALIYNAFSAWRGVTVLEPYRVRDAEVKAQSASGVYDPRAVALSLGAGRYVRGQIGVIPGGRWLVQAWLHQVNVDTALMLASLTVSPSDLERIDRIYGRLAQALLLRGRVADSTGMDVAASASLPAMQSFAAGIEALDEWDFPRADSLFQRALDRDAGYSRAALWQAQVRAWQGLKPPLWAPLTERAMADSMRLPLRERRLASALQVLGTAQHDSACARYRRLTAENRSDFAAWFGLGQCQDQDYRVVRAAGESGGWRYRASFQGAMRAYQTAFEVLALSHRSMERGAFKPLRDLLAMKPSQLRVALPDDPAAPPMLGRLDMEGDTLVMRPVPASLVMSGDPRAVPKRLRDAIASQQRLFRSIAARWSTSLPRSPGAKEAVAVSLEMAGDRAALDTLRAAYALSVDDPATQLRLLTAQLLLRVKLLDAGDVAEAAAIRKAADSIIAAHRAGPLAHSGSMAVAAVLTRDCGLVDRVLRVTPASDNPGLSQEIVGMADALTGRLAMGCNAQPREIIALRERISRSAGAQPDWPNSLLGVATRLFIDRDGALPEALVEPNRDYLTRAQLAALGGKRDSAEAILRRVEASRALTGHEDVRPEAVLLEAKVYLRIGDTTSATLTLDRLLRGRAFLTPGMLSSPPSLAALIESMRLRGELAMRRAERGEPARWTTTAAVFQSPK